MVKKTYHHGNLREALVNAALKMLNGPGEKNITLRSLSSALGVSRTAPYRHFHSKSALMSAVAAQGFSLMRNTFREPSPSSDPEKAICEIMDDYVSFATNNPGLYHLMFSKSLLDSSPSEELLAEAELTFDRLSEILAKLNVGIRATSEANGAAWAMVHGVSLLLNEKLLSVDETGAITHSLITGGKRMTAEQTKHQIDAAAEIVAAGIVARSVTS